VALAQAKDDLSRYLRLAATQEIVITRHGRPAGVIIGFETEDDWFDYRLENHPEFLGRIAAARAGMASGQGVRLEDLDPRPNPYQPTPSQVRRSSPSGGARKPKRRR
jgi:prevent-host-death family protein